MTRNDFAALALGYVDEITAYARRLTGNAWDADDLVQATFEREAVLLCDLWGFAYTEIAEISGVPVGTVRSRIARGRLGLSRQLAANPRDARKPGELP